MADDKKSPETKELEQRAQESHINDLERNKEQANDKAQKEIDDAKEKLSTMQNE